MSSTEPGRFTFARGNAAKVAAVPRYLAGGLRTRFIGRNPDLWVFGSAFGPADGALALLRSAQRHNPDLRTVWLVGTPEQAQAAERLGLTWVAKDSADGFDLTAQARVLAITHGFGDVNRYAVNGATIAQLWHGSPLKKLHADSPAALALGPLTRSRVAQAAMRRAYQRGTSRIGLLPVAADVFQPHMCSAFALTPAQVRVLGEPRTDVLFQGDAPERRAASRALLSAALGDLGDRRIVLYAPTWRDGEPDPGIPTDRQWRRIEQYCQQSGSILLVRPHPLGVGAYRYASDHVRLAPAGLLPESMPLLWGVDTLVTDYSSMLFDFAVTGGPMLFLAPDLEHYAATRGLYFDYPTITGGRWWQDWDDVVDRLQRLDDDPAAADRARAHSATIAAMAHRFHDGGNADRVAVHLLEVSGG